MSDPSILIMDACVLIDYAKSADEALKLIAATYGIVVPDVVMADEVRDLTVEKAIDLGIHVIEVPLDLLQDAMGRSGQLSVYDWICVLMAKANNWICVSNDKRLRTECAAQGVSVQWGLEPLLGLFRSGKLARGKAERIARAIVQQNRYLNSSIIQEFIVKLG